MPLRKEIRRYYGAAWRRYRAELVTLAGNRCSMCGRQMDKYLNGAHLGHDPRNNVRVAILCPSCHSRHDTRQRVAMTRRTRARRSGQLWLLPEIEFAPYPMSFWPTRIVRAQQLDLFAFLC